MDLNHRVLFIKGQTFIKVQIGITNLRNIMVVIGSLIIIIYTVAFSIVDKEVPTTKLCTHESNDDLQIKLQYMVMN